MFDLIVLILGLLGLWGGSLVTIRGALMLSERHGLSHGFIGLTVLAVGTDLPELLVAVSGGIQEIRGFEASGVIVGNATGSVIAQGTLVLGVAGLVGYLRVATRMIRRDGFTLLLVTGLVAALTFDGTVGRMEGVSLLIAYLIYFLALVQYEHAAGLSPSEEHEARVPPALVIGMGILIVTLSAHVVVTEGIRLAEAWGVSQTLLGVLIIGAGTSLPELVLSVGAATKGHASLSVGNVIGSNIFDMLVPVGVGAALHPLLVAPETVTFDLPSIAIGTALLLFFLLRRRGLQRMEALGLLLFYAGYASLRMLIG